MTSLKTLVAGLDRALGALRAMCMLIANCCLVVLIGSFGWLVFGRYVLNATPTWVEQLSLLLVGYITFLGAAVGVRDDTHLGVTFLRDGFGAAASRAMRTIGDLVMAAFGLTMLMSSLDLVRFGYDTLLPMLNIPESVRAAAAAACGGLVFLFAGTRALRRMLGDIPQTDFVRED